MRIMFVGDINLGEYYTAFGHGPRTYMEQSNIFSDVKELLNQADIVAGNLEAPITDYGYESEKVQSSVLRGNPKHASQLAESGFKILQVSNNHIVQHGPEGFNETIAILNNLGIKPIGLKDQKITKIEIDSQTIGFLAASDVTDNTNLNQKCYQKLNLDFINLAKTEVKNVDHLFIMLHWGLESSTKPMSYQKKIIHEMANIGVRGVIGSHPHLFYRIWRENLKTIAAPSLGNFVFDLFWDDRLCKSGILDIELLSDEIINCRVWPVIICKKSGRPIILNYSIEIEEYIETYNLGKDMSGEKLRKLKRFANDYLKGNTKLKTKFISNKLFGKFL